MVTELCPQHMLCRTHNCVNPDHLEPVSNKVNTLRGVGATADNARKTHCPNGHPYDDANTFVYRGSRYCRACQRIRKQAGGKVAGR